MSANIHWKPVEPESSQTLNYAYAPSSFMEIMKRAFGGFPCRVGRDDIPKLKAMAATYTNDENPFQEIADLLEHHEAIDLWARY